MKQYFAIVPQYDANKGLDRGGTEYVACPPEEAEIWALMESDTTDIGDWELVDDYPTREAAYAAAMELGYKPEQEEK